MSGTWWLLCFSWLFSFSKYIWSIISYDSISSRNISGRLLSTWNFIKVKFFWKVHWWWDNTDIFFSMNILIICIDLALLLSWLWRLRKPKIIYILTNIGNISIWCILWNDPFIRRYFLMLAICGFCTFLYNLGHRVILRLICLFFENRISFSVKILFLLKWIGHWSRLIYI
jgi:hypothetical protein